MGFILENGLAQPIAPQSFAETSPLSFSGYLVPHQGLQLENRFHTYAQLYMGQPWVATVVNSISKSIARLDMNVWDTSPATGNILKPANGDGASGYSKLMAKPCPNWAPMKFRNWLASTFEVYGEAFLIKIKNGEDYTRATVVDGKHVTVSASTGRTVGFVPMHPALTQIFRDQYGDLTYRFMGQPNELMSEDMVVPFTSYNPETMMRGISRLEPLRSTLLNEDASRRATAMWWKHMGRPSAVMHVEGKLNPVAKQRLKEQWEAEYQGAENVGKVAIMENGSKIEKLQLSSEEMQYIDSRKLNREEVCAVYDISPTAVHILDHATFSNVTENLRSVYRDSICPRLEYFESVFNHYVGSEFNGQLEMRFDTRQVMKGDFLQRAQAHTMLINAGVETSEEARPEFDLGASGDPAASTLMHQQQLVPLDTPPARTALPQGHSDNVNETATTAAGGGGGPKALTSMVAHKYLRDLAGRVGGGQPLEHAAQELLRANPGDEVEIARAYQQMLERTA
jgi:HK97 family phage portal protein